jgi:hypothetical protein
MDDDVGSVSTVCSDTESDFLDVALEACSFGSFALGAQDTPTKSKAKAGEPVCPFFGQNRLTIVISMNLVTPAVPCLRQVVHALADPASRDRP